MNIGSRKQGIISLLFLSSWFIGLVSADQRINSELEQQAKEFQQGLQLAQEGDLNQALQKWQALSDSAELIPQLNRALQNNIAVVLMNQKRYDAAKQHLDLALNADSQISTTIANLNKLYAYEAQKAYKKVFKNTQVKAPSGEYLYFDLKSAELPNSNVITKIEDIDSVKLIKQATESWRQAWSNQDVSAYLAHYDAKAFIPKDGLSFSTWKKGRYRSLQNPKFINVVTDNIQVSPISDDLVRVNFYQRYHSDRFKDDIEKVLLWKKKRRAVENCSRGCDLCRLIV